MLEFPYFFNTLCTFWPNLILNTAWESCIKVSFRNASHKKKHVEAPATPCNWTHLSAGSPVNPAPQLRPQINPQHCQWTSSTTSRLTSYLTTYNRRQRTCGTDVDRGLLENKITVVGSHHGGAHMMGARASHCDGTKETIAITGVKSWFTTGQAK